MTKTYKAVLKSSLVMLVLFAAGGQRRGAGAGVHRPRAGSPNTVRAEGITEVVGGIELKCRLPEGPSALTSLPRSSISALS